MTKYKKYVDKMINENKKVFELFESLHAQYSLDSEKLQDSFNREGEKILEIVREYESRLCTNTERGKYIKYSSNLADKFQSEVRKRFPMIDHIGLEIVKVQSSKVGFAIKRISLFK